MENNIFEGAKFGDKFKTKDGRCAVLVNRSQYGESVTWILHNWWDYGNRHRFVDAFREHWKKHDEA